MVVLGTDMAIPHDFNRLKVQIRVEGELKLDQDYTIAPDGETTLPGSIAVVAGSQVSPAVDVRVVGISSDGQAQTFSKSVTTIPRNRVATLRIPVQWLCTGNVATTGEGVDAEYSSKCEADNGDEQSCVAGSCKKIDVEEGALKEFEAKAAFGGGLQPQDPDGTCFDTQACFALGFKTEPTLTEGKKYCQVSVSVPKGRDVNFAIQTPPGGAGICDDKDPGAPCFVPFDMSDDFGVRELAAPRPEPKNPALETRTFSLPPAACDRLQQDSTLQITASTACPTKAEGLPTCGPWSSTVEKKPEGVPLDDLGDAVASAYCNGISGCCAAAKLDFDLEVCTSTRAALMKSALAQVFSHHYDYDPIAAGSCLRVYQRVTAACTVGNDAVDTACAAVFKGQQAAGDSCGTDDECKDPEATCEALSGSAEASASERVCRVQKHTKLGASCRGNCTVSVYSHPSCYDSVASTVTGGGYCYESDDVFCQVSDYTKLGACRAVVKTGKSCGDLDQCEAGSYCDLASGKCKRATGCTNVSCPDGDFCDIATQTCSAKREAGEACKDGGECLAGVCLADSTCDSFINAMVCSSQDF